MIPRLFRQKYPEWRCKAAGGQRQPAHQLGERGPMLRWNLAIIAASCRHELNDAGCGGSLRQR